MITRQLAPLLKKAARQFPLVGIVGPRQSGKTTLARAVFPDYTYVSLEDLDVRQFAKEDPRQFLATYSNKIILDEVQNVPELFSYLQTHTDKNGTAGQYVLTGSQHFLMMEAIGQTLAGRISLNTLLPLSLLELESHYKDATNATEYLYKGSFPRIYDHDIAPKSLYPSYIQTYIERDIRSIKQITDLHAFQSFIKLCAGRVGQLLNLSSLANDAGITHNTAKAWLSLLEASFIVFLLQPHHRNFNKRIVKSPKLYFVDTGLASSLLGIETAQQLATHHLVGSIFENMVVSEYRKYRFNHGLLSNSYFWRDKVGHEVDLLIEQAEKLVSIEIKSGKTISGDYFTNLDYWQKLSGFSPKDSHIVYGGNEHQQRSVAKIYSWNRLNDLFEHIAQ